MCNLLVWILQIESVFGGTVTISTHMVTLMSVSCIRSNVGVMYVSEHRV
jgi:hypothetical protein